MLQMIIKKLVYKYVPRPNYKAINELRYEREVLPFYIIARNNFKMCMQYKYLKREDILIIKGILSEITDDKYYANRQFKNDAHEIYVKLANKYITQEQMKHLNTYIECFLPEELQTRIDKS